MVGDFLRAAPSSLAGSPRQGEEDPGPIAEVSFVRVCQRCAQACRPVKMGVRDLWLRSLRCDASANNAGRYGSGAPP